MRLCYLLGFFLMLSCRNQESSSAVSTQHIEPGVVDTLSYDQLKKNVSDKRKLFNKASLDLKNPKNLNVLKDYWVNTLLNDFYPKWAQTPWDYNGTTEQPGVGNIACGYFVTTLLRDMGVKIQRIKLAVCPSSEMMKALVPGQELINLSSLSFNDFNNRITAYGKGVYIIGLDFHTGFIINDGTENWALHSNYIDRQGVTKETILNSDAFRSSKTRWLVCLTSDIDFLSRWIK